MSKTAATVAPAITAVLFLVFDEDRSEPKLAVANEVKLEEVRVEVSVEVVWWEVLVGFGRISTSFTSVEVVWWEVLVDFGRISTSFTAVELAMVDNGVACNIAAPERALDGE